MISQQPSTASRTNERGSAILGVLLLLMMMSALAAALTLSGNTETLVARNHRSATQARAAAEAGLNHSSAVVLEYIWNWSANGFASPEAVLAALLLGPDGASGTAETDADNGSLAALGIPIDTRLDVADGVTAEYEARVMDEDDPDRGTVPDAALVGEDGDPTTNANTTLVIRSVGYGEDNSSGVLEALIMPLDMGAIVTNGDLTIGGNASIEGTNGDVHSNGDLTLDGESSSVTGDATTSGELDCDDPCDNVDGTTSEGTAEIPVHEVNASDHRGKADFILTASGTMTDAHGNPVTCCNNWTFSSGTWTLNSLTAPNGTYYVEGTAVIAGNLGQKAPVALSVIAEGSISVSGTPKIIPDYPELLFVTNGDLKLVGNADVGAETLTGSGQILVHEQIQIQGNVELVGQVIVEDATSVDTLVGANSVSGNATITYNGGLGDNMYYVSSWREVR